MGDLINIKLNGRFGEKVSKCSNSFKYFYKVIDWKAMSGPESMKHTL